MSDKHKHRLLLHTNVSYVLVYPRSPLCATLPSHMISGPSCHALRPIPSPYDHLTSPHLQGWTHALCSALPCDTLSSGCPMPAIFTALFSSFPLPMSSYALLYSCFFTSRELLIYPSFLIHQKWSRSDTTSWRSHRQHVRLCPDLLLYPAYQSMPVTGDLQHGRRAACWAEYFRDTGQAWRRMTFRSASTGQKNCWRNTKFLRQVNRRTFACLMTHAAFWMAF